MKICVVIPTFNNKKLLTGLLKQLRGIPEFDQLLITVVDNGSLDGTSDMVRAEFPENQLLTLAENSGGSGGFIAGVEHAMTLGVDYIWLLDDDVEIRGDSLSLLLDAAKKLDGNKIKWGAIGSMMANLDKPELVVETGAEVVWRRGCFKLYNNGLRVEDIKPEIKRVPYCAAASLLTRPEVVEKVGFFENIFIHFDDVEWCMRMEKAGYGIYCNTASVIWHMTVKGAPVTWVRYYDARNFLWLCRKYNKKWLYLSIFRMLLKAFYFKMHRMPVIAKLYMLGIKDAFSGRLRMRKELEVDEMIDVDDILPELHGRKIIGVFKNSSNREELQKTYPEIMDNVEKIYCYERGRAVLLSSFWHMLFHPKHLVIFDGNCYHGMMLPPLLNDTFYVFPRHKKAIRRMGRKA